ncbi:MAG: type III-A CRISPR-associated protein Cas10/Csm1 [Deltaproteobacteria bacterium]|nr:type III-A CRISPR-associated protein Cas10/Csm1 [Deltaproteobacteria bacterium]
MAGMLHDIGKFAERGNMPVTPKYINDNADLYQPFYNNRHSHKHAVYTAAFIEQNIKLLPQEFNAHAWGLSDSFINLAAGHHKPETPIQWIVAVADRVSSGFDRDEFESYNKGIDFRDYKKTRLLPIIEGVSFEKKSEKETLDSYHYRYPLKAISPASIFPEKKSEIERADAEKEYEELFSNFIDALQNLEHRKHVLLWFEHFDSLFCACASHIPAATVGNVIPDVSLYDHCRATGALAAALYLFHDHTKTLTTEKVKNYDDKKFLILTGDFYGIQDFIFSEGSETGKASAKLLRGRSFAVSLISELAADLMCRKMGLPGCCIILNAAGKFTIIAPNTSEAQQNIAAAEQQVNQWLYKRFFGQCALGISWVEASCDDLVSGKFGTLWERLAASVERKKYARFSLDDFGGAVHGYLDEFNNTLKSPLCPFCSKRPSAPMAENDPLLGEAVSACPVCRDHIYLGTRLVKTTRIAIGHRDAPFEQDCLLDPIFDFYQVSLDVSGKLLQLADTDQLYKYWDIAIPNEQKGSVSLATKYINGYVPVYTDRDGTNESLDRLLAGKKSEKLKDELFDMIRDGWPKTFLHLAKQSLNQSPDGKFCGIEALGILKADVDNLGRIFGCGLSRMSLSRLATLSRQMNNFFTLYLPHLLSNDKRFQDIYTVFAGGDDLFLIGPWNHIIDFADFFNEAFGRYASGNRQVTLSAGISVNKPNEPVSSLAERSEQALHKAKTSGRNAITLFAEPVPWHVFKELQAVQSTMQSWLDTEVINKAMLYRFNDFTRLAGEEKSFLAKPGFIEDSDWTCLKWRSMFKYSIVRNVGKKLKGDEKLAAISQVEQAGAWFNTYSSAMKIPLWQIIYNQR